MSLSCILNQLISITHDIFHLFNNSELLEVRGVFLEMSKAFEKAWHKGLLYKRETMETLEIS